MPLSPGPMARHISSKAVTTGDLQMARKTQTIPNLSVKGLMEYLTMLMLPLFGLEMGKSISSKEHNTGGLNLTTVHQWRTRIHAQYQTGKEYQTILMMLLSTTMATHISLKEASTTDLMTLHFRWEYFLNIRFKDLYVAQVDKADPPYPRPAGYWWFGCTKPSQPLKKNETERNLKEDAQLANNLSRQDTVTNEIIDKGKNEVAFYQ